MIEQQMFSYMWLSNLLHYFCPFTWVILNISTEKNVIESSPLGKQNLISHIICHLSILKLRRMPITNHNFTSRTNKKSLSFFSFMQNTKTHCLTAAGRKQTTAATTLSCSLRHLTSAKGYLIFIHKSWQIQSLSPPIFVYIHTFWKSGTLPIIIFKAMI